MKLGTYFGLVARRVWAKRGILIGSLLGATLVTALLVVVPLYESSVQAVDLRFTVKGAVADEVDMTAFSTMTHYESGTGTANRETVLGAHEQWLVPYYPTIEERSQTREYRVVPEGDWFERAEAWREQMDQAIAEEVPEEELPSPPYPRPPQEATQVRFFTAPDVEDRLVVVEGEFPDPLLGVPVSQNDPLPIAVGDAVAKLTGYGVGDRFFLKPFSGLPPVFEYVEVAAIVAPADPDATIWGIDDPAKMVYLDQATFDVWTGVIPVETGTDPFADASVEGDPWRRPVRGFDKPTVTQRWRMPLDDDTVTLDELDEIQSRINQFKAQVAKEASGSIPTSTFLPLLLDEFSTRSVVIGGPILAMLALVVGGAIYFLVYTSALTVEREGSDLAVLKSRGASAWQTTGIHLGQSIVIAAAAAVLAPFVARWLVGVTGRVPPLSDLTGGEPLDVTQINPVTAWLFAGAIITFLAMGVAIVPYVRKSVLELRSLAARPGTKSVWQRYNLDLFAIALSLVVLLQLSQRGFVNTTGDEVTLDPLAIVFPVLLLFSGALILLRLFPLLLRFVGWVMTKSRSMSLSLPGWHLGRNPIPYGRLALLVWLTTGLGAFALTYASTLEQSFVDRAAFAAGSDVRVVDVQAGYLDVPDGAIGSPVLRTDGAPRRSGRRAEVLAIRPESFSDVVTWRSDFGAGEPQDIFSLIRPDGAPPDVGVELPDGTTKLVTRAAVIPMSLAEEAEFEEPVEENKYHLLAKVIDGKSRLWTMISEQPITPERWSTITIDLTTGKNDFPTPPEPPLSIHAIWLERDTTSSFAVAGDSILLDPIVAVTESGREELDLEEMSTMNGFIVGSSADADEAVEARYARLPEGTETPTTEEIEADPLYRKGDVARWSVPERTRANALVPQLRRIPDDIYVLLDHEAAAIASLNVGDTSSYSVGAQVMNGTLVGFVDSVPTMTDRRREGAMVIDLDAYSAWTNGAATWSLVGSLSRPEAPGELWMKTDNVDTTVRRVTAQIGGEPEELLTIRGVAASFTSRPVQVGLVAILFVGAAVAVVLALAGVTGYVLLAVTRRAKEMGVLRALGFNRRGVATTFAVEQLVVVGLGAVIGVLGGIGLVVVMLPFLQLGETAEEIIPSILIDVPGIGLSLFSALVGLMLIASVVWATRRVSVRKMSEVLREVDR
ncbi:MAG: ABC transporter permease [Actinomycetota bacterium]